MRLATSLLALLIALFGAVPAAHAARSTDPKVVFIVGPAGEATNRYRERAEAAARIADRYTSNVVRLYSPDATWPAVRQALQGAAVVVYLGHGNGWPSRYREEPYGPTQNGFGLNPVAGSGDGAHQYFGEDLIAAEIELADNAIVLLHHLCYASGNTEPGLPEGTIDQARQRVVNYAAGFVAAGASAVVAEGHMGPAWYIRQLFASNRSIDRIWRASPTAHGNEFRFQSSRSPGYVAAMDPDHGDRGFYRSIVYRGEVGGGQLEGSPGPDLPLEPPEPTLVGSGLSIGTAYIKAPPVAGAPARLWFPYEATDPDALRGLTVGVRWDPIDVADGSAAEEGAEPATPEPSEPPPSQPAPSEGNEAADDTGDAAETDEAAESPAAPGAGAPVETPAPPADPSAERVAWIQPERVGDVVEPVAAIVGPTRVVVDVALPAAPGRYRLVPTLHDADGVAYDAATQGLLSGLIVDVASPLDARYLVAASVDATAGDAIELPVGVANVGAEAWAAVGADRRRGPEELPPAARLVAHWVALGDGEAPARSAAARLSERVEPGATERVDLRLTAPEEPGEYLLVLDVIVPGSGSVTAQGVEPAFVRVSVN
jgi:hypothetical protein